MDRERIDELSQPVIDIYNQMQAEMLVRIARRLAGEIGEFEALPEWEARKMEQLNLLTEDNILVISKYSGKTRGAVKKVLENVGIEGIQQNEELFQQAKKKGASLADPPPPEQSNALINILAVYESQAIETLNLTNSTMLDQSEQVYRDIINQTTADVISGTKTSQQALRDTVRRWAHRGIPALIDSAGREWGAEGYVRTVIRSTSNNVTNEMQDQRFDEWGQDLVEVSSHMGARPKCAPYQGRIYSRSGESRRFPAMSSTSRGEPDGLFGINCGHVQYPYFPGLSTKWYNPPSKTRNAQAYKNMQRQRKIERDIRNAKTEKRMMEALKDEEGINIANQRIYDKQSQMRKFIKDTGRTRRRGREQIYS